MKKIFAGFMVLIFLMVSTFAFAGGYWWNQELKATLGKDGRSWQKVYVGDEIIYEGDTSDAYETILTVEEPTADNTITLPNYTGGLPIVIAQIASTETQAGSGSSDIVGSTITTVGTWLSAGKAIKWTIAGTKTGANAAMKVHLYLKDGTVMSLTASDAVAGDWIASFILYAKSAVSQNVVGELKSNAKSVITDYATSNKDTSVAVSAKVKIESQNAGDTVTSEYTLIEHWVK